MDDPEPAYLECLAILREDPLDAKALWTLANLYAEVGHRTHALWYLRKAEYLDEGLPGLRRLKERLRNWDGLNGGPARDSK